MADYHGIIFAYSAAPEMGELVKERTSASVPFCARYRLIDFSLSSLRNAGIRNAGVIMQRDYQSLMDHCASGKAWDMTRKNGGLKLLPPFGVYASRVYLGGKEYRGMTNIGRKPTISAREKVGVETYIYDFDDDAYGEFIEVELIRFVRPEMKFENLDMLKAQIQSDLVNAREHN